VSRVTIFLILQLLPQRVWWQFRAWLSYFRSIFQCPAEKELFSSERHKLVLNGFIPEVWLNLTTSESRFNKGPRELAKYFRYISDIYNEVSLYQGSFPYMLSGYYWGEEYRLLSYLELHYIYIYRFVRSMFHSVSRPIIAQLYLWSQKKICLWKTTELISIEFYLSVSC